MSHPSADADTTFPNTKSLPRVSDDTQYSVPQSYRPYQNVTDWWEWNTAHVWDSRPQFVALRPTPYPRQINQPTYRERRQERLAVFRALYRIVNAQIRTILWYPRHRREFRP